MTALRTAADRSVGAFSDNPPWLINREQLTWRVGLSAIRSVARREVPKMIAEKIIKINNTQEAIAQRRNK